MWHILYQYLKFLFGEKARKYRNRIKFVSKTQDCWVQSTGLFTNNVHIWGYFPTLYANKVHFALSKTLEHVKQSIWVVKINIFGKLKFSSWWDQGSTFKNRLFKTFTCGFERKNAIYFYLYVHITHICISHLYL